MTGWFRGLHWISAVTIATALMVVCVLWDREVGGAAFVQRQLVSTRQAAAQVETLTLAASERGEEDPLGWAISHLNLSEGERWISFSRTQITAETPDEHHIWDTDHGEFSYFKRIDVETRAGVKITLNGAKRYFLGATSFAGNDGLVFLIWLVLFGGCVAVYGLYGVWSTPQQTARGEEPVVIQEPTDTEWIGAWSAEARVLLAQLGVHLKGLLEEANHVVISVQKTKSPQETLEAAQKMAGTLQQIRADLMGQARHLQSLDERKRQAAVAARREVRSPRS